jgi:cytidylate kinase
MVESIIVTGAPFSGKTTLAKLLAEQFGWKYFSIEESWMLEWKRKYPKGDTSFDNYMLQTTDDEQKAMDRLANEVVMEGHVVADLRYGFLHRDPRVLIVFTTCGIDERVKRALGKKTYPNRDFVQVKEILEQADRDQADRCVALYGTDFRDPKNYDMDFDTTDTPPDAAIERIMSLRE